MDLLLGGLSTYAKLGVEVTLDVCVEERHCDGEDLIVAVAGGDIFKAEDERVCCRCWGWTMNEPGINIHQEPR